MIFNVGAGNGGSVVYLTQAEYDALPDSKLTNNIEYRITDGDMGVATASNLSYDNSFSSLEAVSVQGAIDELSKQKKYKDFIIPSTSLNAKETTGIAVDSVNGYEATSVKVITATNSAHRVFYLPYLCTANNGNPTVYVMNTYTSALENAITIRVYYDMVESLN